MKLTNYFLPTLKENPIDATIVSHQFMVRAGMIRQTASGIYSWLPMGLKVLKKVENIIHEEMAKIGALEILMPTIQPSDLWEESGRFDTYGAEMLKIKDRHDRDMLFGPTCEEVITDIFRKNVTSYKDLPLNLYQIHWKFRDEIRPRFGVMRGREFLMKDGYSFDLDEKKAKETYQEIYKSYFKIFKKMGLNAIALRAANGEIGGELSHEFHILAKSGESEIFYDKILEEKINSGEFDFDEMQKIYAVADEMHDDKNCPIPFNRLASKRSVEVGHIFNFGQKYSKAMEAGIMNNDGKKIYPNMGSYGIGVSRVVAGAIEANHDENGIIWPKEIAPFDVYLINIKNGDEMSDKLCDEIYQNLKNKNIDVIYDDRKASLGQKFSNADLIGIPTQIIVGPRSAAIGKVEIKNRQNGEKQEINAADILQFFKK